ncbi:MAG: cellulose-binding domain-containing protein [Actinoplanes sp.]
MRSRLLAAAAATTVVAGTITAIVAQPASAAAGCKVIYTVASQWNNGFTADVSVQNLGDPLTSWTLTWTFANGQQVTQAWNATTTQSGGQVSARNVSHNGAVGTGASTSFGFNGSWTGTNAAPAGFTLNGTACTGAPVTSAPTTPPGSEPPTSPPPTGNPAWGQGPPPAGATHSRAYHAIIDIAG